MPVLMKSIFIIHLLICLFSLILGKPSIQNASTNVAPEIRLHINSTAADDFAKKLDKPIVKNKTQSLELKIFDKDSNKSGIAVKNVESKENVSVRQELNASTNGISKRTHVRPENTKDKDGKEMKEHYLTSTAFTRKDAGDLHVAQLKLDGSKQCNINCVYEKKKVATSSEAAAKSHSEVSTPKVSDFSKFSLKNASKVAAAQISEVAKSNKIDLAKAAVSEVLDVTKPKDIVSGEEITAKVRDIVRFDDIEHSDAAILSDADRLDDIEDGNEAKDTDRDDLDDKELDDSDSDPVKSIDKDKILVVTSKDVQNTDSDNKEISIGEIPIFPPLPLIIRGVMPLIPFAFPPQSLPAVPPALHISDRLPVSEEDAPKASSEAIEIRTVPHSESRNQAQDLESFISGVFRSMLGYNAPFPSRTISLNREEKSSDAKTSGNEESSKVLNLQNQKYLMKSKMLDLPAERSGRFFIRFMSLHPLKSDGLLQTQQETEKAPEETILKNDEQNTEEIAEVDAINIGNNTDSSSRAKDKLSNLPEDKRNIESEAAINSEIFAQTNSRKSGISVVKKPNLEEKTLSFDGGVGQSLNGSRSSNNDKNQNQNFSSVLLESKLSPKKKKVPEISEDLNLKQTSNVKAKSIDNLKAEESQLKLITNLPTNKTKTGFETKLRAKESSALNLTALTFNEKLKEIPLEGDVTIAPSMIDMLSSIDSELLKEQKEEDIANQEKVNPPEATISETKDIPADPLNLDKNRMADIKVDNQVLKIFEDLFNEETYSPENISLANKGIFKEARSTETGVEVSPIKGSAVNSSSKKEIKDGVLESLENLKVVKDFNGADGKLSLPKEQKNQNKSDSEYIKSTVTTHLKGDLFFEKR